MLRMRKQQSVLTLGYKTLGARNLGRIMRASVRFVWEGLIYLVCVYWNNYASSLEDEHELTGTRC